MSAITLKDHVGNDRYTEEKISVQAYSTSEALKNGIRKAISDYRKKGWDLVCILTQGSFIHLEFKQRSG